MTDITQSKRSRQELAAAQDRFTPVLDELDAAVSVRPLDGPGEEAPPDGGPLLFPQLQFPPPFHPPLAARPPVSRRRPVRRHSATPAALGFSHPGALPNPGRHCMRHGHGDHPRQ